MSNATPKRRRALPAKAPAFPGRDPLTIKRGRIERRGDGSLIMLGLCGGCGRSLQLSRATKDGAVCHYCGTRYTALGIELEPRTPWKELGAEAQRARAEVADACYCELKTIRAKLAAFGFPKATAAVARAMKSTAGAARHAQCMRTRQEMKGAAQ